MADGDIKLKATVDASPANKTLDSLKAKIKNTFSGNETDKLDSKVIKASENVKKLTNDLSQVKSQMREISSGDVVPKSITSLEKEIQKAEKELAKLDQKFEKLATEQGNIADKAITIDGKQWLSPEDTMRMQELDQQIIKNGQDTDAVTGKLEKMRSKLAELKANPELTPEFQKLSNKSSEINGKLDTANQKLDEIGNKNVTSPFEAMGKSVSSVLKRIKGLVKRVLFFSVITKMLRSVREQISAMVGANAQLSNSLAQIKGNLSTAFQSLFNAILPGLQRIADALALCTARLAQFVSYITGKSINASRDQAKALYDQANATKSAGKAAEEAQKSTLGFDELNTISTEKDKGGGSGGAATPGFQTNDLTMTSEIEQKMQAILTLVGLIGGALLAWKITDFITQLMTSEKALASFHKGFGKFLAIIMIIAGAVLLVKGYLDAWVNGIDWKNFALILSGLALIIGGIALAVSPLAAAFVLVGGAISLVVLGIKDLVTNGTSFQNILMILIGIIGIVAGVFWALSVAEVAAAWPIALIVGAIALLVAGFVLLWNKCEGFRNFWITLWEDIKTKAIEIWENILKPALEALGQKFIDIYNNYIKPMIDNIVNLWNEQIYPIIQGIGVALKWLWDNILAPIVGFIVDVFAHAFAEAFEWIGNIVEGAVSFITGLINSLIDIIRGIADILIGIFTLDFKRAFDGLVSIIKGIINAIITIIELGLNYIIAKVNIVIGALSSVVGAIGDIIGADWSIPQIPSIKIPRLAQGAVLPANNPFLAVVGDQKHGTNIEAPLSTIEEAVENVLKRKGMSTGNQPINIVAKGDLAALIRLLKFELDNEDNRVGPKLSTGGAY